MSANKLLPLDASPPAFGSGSSPLLGPSASFVAGSSLSGRAVGASPLAAALAPALSLGPAFDPALRLAFGLAAPPPGEAASSRFGLFSLSPSASSPLLPAVLPPFFSDFASGSWLGFTCRGVD